MRYEEDASLLLLQQHSHKTSISSSLLAGSWSHEPAHAAAVFIKGLLPLSVGLLIGAVVSEVFFVTNRFSLGLAGMRGLWLKLAILCTVDVSIFIPISYDIAEQLGYGALASGMLVAASQVFQPFLALLARWLLIGTSYANQRRFIILCLGAQTIFTWLMVPVLDLCNHWDNQVVLSLLIFLRAMTGGVIMLYGVPLGICVYDSCPLEERQSLSIRYYLCLSVGVCLGPFVSSFMLTLHQGGEHDACYTGRQSISTLGFVWAVVALLSTRLMPESIEEFREREKPVAEDQVELSQAQAVQRIPQRVRENLVWAAVMFAAERSFSIGAIEVATAMLLEVQYAWQPEAIGYALTVIFFITALVGALIWFLRSHVSDFWLMGAMASVSIVGAVLFLDFGGSGPGGHSNPWLLMFADITVYSCMFQLTAFMEGIATEAALPGTYCSLENYIVARNLAVQIPRALGPPVARGLIDICGRNTYAVLQLVLSSVAISGVWYAAKNARSTLGSKEL